MPLVKTKLVLLSVFASDSLLGSEGKDKGRQQRSSQTQVES